MCPKEILEWWGPMCYFTSMFLPQYIFMRQIEAGKDLEMTVSHGG